MPDFAFRLTSREKLPELAGFAPRQAAVPRARYPDGTPAKL